jgi:hypothetical protein
MAGPGLEGVASLGEHRMDYGGRVDAVMGPMRWHRCGPTRIASYARQGEALPLTFMTDLEI